MLKMCWEKVRDFHRNEDGDIVQTAIIIAVLALVAIAVLTPVRTKIASGFNQIDQALRDAFDWSR